MPVDRGQAAYIWLESNDTGIHVVFHGRVGPPFCHWEDDVAVYSPSIQALLSARMLPSRTIYHLRSVSIVRGDAVEMQGIGDFVTKTFGLITASNLVIKS
jgi:hypothetical protein